jgi:SAM-dependent methyltransferase
MADTFYQWFSQRRLTRLGGKRRERIEAGRFALLEKAAGRPGDLLELGPGHGAIAEAASRSGWRYSAVEASRILAEQLRQRGFDVVQAWVPPIPAPAASCDAVYADQVLEHMPGIEAARELTAEAWRVLRPGGVFFVVVPDYLKERGFFFDIDYTHNFVTTERRVRQLLLDNGFEVERFVRSIGAATGVSRDLLALASVFAHVPGLDAVARYVRAEEALFRVRKNFFQTLTFVARKPHS